jgi:ribosomal protein L37AE/L43A
MEESHWVCHACRKPFRGSLHKHHTDIEERKVNGLPPQPMRCKLCGSDFVERIPRRKAARSGEGKA